MLRSNLTNIGHKFYVTTIHTCDHRDNVCTMRTYTLPLSGVSYKRSAFFYISG